MTAAPGVLVALEGPSGTGKTTLAALVAESLKRTFPVLLTRQPSDGPLGLQARHGTGRHRGPALACLVAADRYDHLDQTIAPALAAGSVVLCDRYILSSFVLQVLDGVDRGFVASLNSLAPEPDLYVVLHAAPTTAAARVTARGPTSRFHPSDAARAALEADLYASEAKRAEAAGTSLMKVDTTQEAPPDLASRIADAVLDRWTESR